MSKWFVQGHQDKAEDKTGALNSCAIGFMYQAMALNTFLVFNLKVSVENNPSNPFLNIIFFFFLSLVTH